MDSLTALAEQEDALLRVVESVTGLMEEKSARLSELGVYQQYRDVFGRYAQLLADPKDSAEALKRALFLSWYSVSEPPCFTGLLEMQADDLRSVLETLNLEFATGAADEELRWMVAYYYYHTDFAFPDLDGRPDLARFLESADSDSYLHRDPKPQEFVGRGQMGAYWQSILYSRSNRTR